MSDFWLEAGIRIKMEGTLPLSQTKAFPLTADDLCRTYAGQVCRFAALMSRGPQDAEDLAQEALLHAVRSLRSYDPSRGSVESWLWRIVANSAKDAAGARQRWRDLVLGIRTVPREVESVEELALRQLRDEELHGKLLRLSVRDRTLLALRFGLDLELEQVGASVGLSPDSAGKAVRRALERLRALLKESAK